MQYVIHSTVVFNTIDYTLTSILNKQNQSIKLSNAAGKILEELIDYQSIGIPVTREHIFSVVWRNYGLEPSHGNLNQQISLIRKAFISLGLNETSIITVPKRGIKLNNKLIIEKIKKETKLYNRDQHTVSKHMHSNIDNVVSSIILHTKTHIKYIITLIIMTIIILSMGIVHFHKKQNDIKLYCCKEIDSCNICTLYNVPKTDNNNYSISYSEVI